MTWLGELRHLLTKDLIEHRWTVGLYVAAVLVATGHVLGWHSFTAPVLGSTMVFVGLIGGVLVASAVQGDSPTRSDAFWASHPIDASAVLAAKICLGIGVLVLPILAQVFAMQRYDVPFGDALAMSLHDARFYALIILGAMLVAALTRDLKSFVLTVIAIPVALLICVAIISARNGNWGFTVKPEEGQIATVLFAIVEVVLLVWLYHTRDARWFTKLAGFALVGLSYVGLTFAGNAPVVRTEGVAQVDHAPIRIEWASRREQQATSPLAMALVIGPTERGLSYEFAAASAIARLRDGSTITLWVSTLDIGPGLNFPVELPVIPGIRWLYSDADSARDVAGQGLHRVIIEPVPTDERRRVLDTGIEQVVVKGTMVVAQQRAGAAVPLAAGSSDVRGGRSVEIESMSRDGTNTEIEVRTRKVLRQLLFARPGSDRQLEYVLVNRVRGEGVLLAVRETRFSGDGIVVPGSTMTSQLVRCALPTGPGGSAIVDDAWLRDAELQTIDAIPLGSYDVQLPPLAPAPEQ